MSRQYLRIIGISLFLVAFLGTGCKKKQPAPTPPPPPPAAAPAPAATLTANPTSIERGQSSTLEWSSKNAADLTLEPGLGSVAASGSRSVQPTESTTYRLTAKGPGGSTTATARITVTAPPPPPPPPPARGPSEEELFLQSVHTIYFDYDKSDVRDDQRSTLQANGEFLRAHANVSVVLEGHCDERGSEEYNLGLGDRRANSTKEFLVAMGIPAGRIRTISYGKERPACTEHDEQCWQKNRRAQFVLAR